MRVVALEPWHAEDNWVMAEFGQVEEYMLLVSLNVEGRFRNMRDAVDNSAVEGLERSWCGEWNNRELMTVRIIRVHK